ncbi:septum formation initiator family protein [Thalassobaculum sp. OXR-137]|uniref:FtsB family cell division protein n=1 Tax=Thalassobaculum sp. OXR-137 TaxID=3100173 RepID=UPI002AC944CD|nr:septum formation initiator family protein [Thalassobaculum sp. OXR-137]WPZ33244.1 septum formation initiator family protein [Thalassobaculum sp. OXR-137]
MSLSAELKRRVPKVLGPLMASLLMAYFAYHAVEGDRGLRAWQRLDIEIAEASDVLAEVSAEREALENKVARLNPANLDTDMLEERARLVLGYIPSNSVVIGNGLVPKDGLVLNVAVR